MQKRKTHRYRKQTCGYQRGKKSGEGHTSGEKVLSQVVGNPREGGQERSLVS